MTTYRAIGGIGLRVTLDILKVIGYNEFIEGLNMKKSDWIADFLCALECTEGGVNFDTYEYDGGSNYVWLVPGKTLIEVDENIPEFIESFKKLGHTVRREDLEVISELYIC